MANIRGRLKAILVGVLVVFAGFGLKIYGEEFPNTIVFNYKDGTTQTIDVSWGSMLTIDGKDLCLTAGNESFRFPIQDVVEYSFVYDPASFDDMTTVKGIKIKCIDNLLTISCVSNNADIRVTTPAGIMLTKVSVLAGQNTAIDLSKFTDRILVIIIDDKTFKIIRQ